MTKTRIALAALALIVVAAAGFWFWRGSQGTGARLPALAADGWRVELPVAGHGPVSVAVPLGAQEPRPLVIVLHGDADRPEWQCGSWRNATKGQAFVICPRGKPLAGAKTFTLGSVDDTAHELRAAIKAVKERFGPYLARGPVVLAGFGIGGEHAVAIARREPSFFAKLVLTEGGIDDWSASAAGIFKHGGGERVLFVCSSARCRDAAERKLPITRSLDLPAELLFAGDIGGVFDGRVVQAVAGKYSWLMAKDTRPTISRKKLLR